MEYRKQSSALKKLVTGLMLRCPNCEQGALMKNWFEVKSVCPVCNVRFERSPGEGTGAMMIVLSLVPLPLILLFILLYNIWQVALPVLLIVMIIAPVLLALLIYRHARGIWVSVIFLSGGLYTDDEKPLKT